MIKAMLIDPAKCIGCRSCQVACKQWNQLPAESTSFNGSYENPPTFSPLTWTRIVFKERETAEGIIWNLTKQGCMHCYDAACMIVCPAGAIYRTEHGTVAIDSHKCIGCNYCVANCPFDAISFDRNTNLATKCTFCVDRIANGLKPACAGACPTGAIIYGTKSAIVEAAYRRVAELKKQGKNAARAYGIEEVQGTGMVYVLAEAPEYYGLPNDPQVPFGAWLWGSIFKPLRFLVVVLAGIGLWINRSQSKALQEASDKNDKVITSQQEIIAYQDGPETNDNNSTDAQEVTK